MGRTVFGKFERQLPASYLVFDKLVSEQARGLLNTCLGLIDEVKDQCASLDQLSMLHC